MVSSGSTKVLISTLKGRISKIFGVKANLTTREREGLENIYYTIDKFIIGDEEFKDNEVFKDALSNYLSFIEKSRKEYIQEYIVPLVTKISTNKWSENE